MLHTTARLAYISGACDDEFTKVEAALGGFDSYGKDTPVPLSAIVEHASLDAALWALRCVLPGQEAERDRVARLFACDCAEAVLDVVERDSPGESRPRLAIEVARRFAFGEATREELNSAAADAWAATMTTTRDASGAWIAAWPAAWPAVAASDAARAAASFCAAARDVQKQFFLARLGETVSAPVGY